MLLRLAHYFRSFSFDGTMRSQAGNMLSDHMASRYYEGLLEVQAIRASKKDLPSWVGFADDCTWCVGGG